MVYTKKHPALLIMGIIFVAIAALTDTGTVSELVDYLKAGKYSGEMVWLGYSFGAIGVIIGAWHLWASHEQGNLDYYLSTIAGAIFILLIAMLVVPSIATPAHTQDHVVVQATQKAALNDAIAFIITGISMDFIPGAASSRVMHRVSA